MTLSEQLHRLWTKAVGRPDYVKAEWREFCGAVERLETDDVDWTRRTQQLDDLRRDLRELLDELKPPFPPMILENERVEAGGAGRKCGDCGHLFERGEKSFEGDRCETCAKVELTARVDLARKRQLNHADLPAGGVHGFPFGRRP